MSTNSMIAMKTDTGYESIYVHWDGHLDGVGKTLLEIFNTTDKVAELIALGDCSSIAGAKNLDEIEAYCRDHGENWTDVHTQHHPTLSEAIHYYRNPYNYIWDNEKWIAYEHGDIVDEWGE